MTPEVEAFLRRRGKWEAGEYDSPSQPAPSPNPREPVPTDPSKEMTPFHKGVAICVISGWVYWVMKK